MCLSIKTLAYNCRAGNLFTPSRQHSEVVFARTSFTEPNMPKRDPDQSERTALLNRRHALFEIIADSNPRSQMLVINEAGHFCYREQPEVFNQIITGFVRRVVQARS
jgi:hypothetical protein